MPRRSSLSRSLSEPSSESFVFHLLEQTSSSRALFHLLSALTGLPRCETQGVETQDWVTEKQPWLDGVATEPNVVRREFSKRALASRRSYSFGLRLIDLPSSAAEFVAVPLGSAYSVEKQVTGVDSTGALQVREISLDSRRRELGAEFVVYSYFPSSTSSPCSTETSIFRSIEREQALGLLESSDSKLATHFR